MIIFLHSISSFYPVDLTWLVCYSLDTEDVAEEVPFCLGEFLHTFLEQSKVLHLEFLDLLSEEGEFIEIFEVVLEHDDGVRVFLLLLIFFLIEIALSL